MSYTPLTSGALARICQGEEVHEPVLQVLGQKVILGSGQERFRLLLNDGEYSNSFAMLATQLNHLVYENALPQYTVIKVKKYVCNQMADQGKRVTILLDLEVLQKGDVEGRKIGNPVNIGADGKVAPINPHLAASLNGQVPPPNTNQALQQIDRIGNGGNEGLGPGGMNTGAKPEDVKNFPPPISIPECLICMEEMSPPTKIVQCLKGHKICEPCSQREEVMFCPGHCKTGFTGFRDFGMEAFILKMTDEAQGLRASGSSKSK